MKSVFYAIFMINIYIRAQNNYFSQPLPSPFPQNKNYDRFKKMTKYWIVGHSTQREWCTHSQLMKIYSYVNFRQSRTVTSNSKYFTGIGLKILKFCKIK